MKTYSCLLSALLVIVLSLGVASCNKDNTRLPQAQVTSVKYYKENKMTAYNIEYPSKDPYGNPVTLSGAITVGDEIKDGKAPAVGIVLMNHYTAFQRDECPSKGGLTLQKFVVGSRMVCVSADYYGFGCTEDKNQAYCMGSVNAQASIDCLLAARELLPGLNIVMDKSKDYLFNLGYSQGGQTTIAVEKLVSEKYPDIRITHSFAGGGIYDMPSTYTWMRESDTAGMPSAIISVMLAFNEYYKLDIPRDKLLRGEVLAHADEWFLGKNYTREEIDAKIGPQRFSDFAGEEIQDRTSEVSLKLMEALQKENLVQGWKPAKGARIAFVHHKDDISVPPVNQTNIYNYLVYTLGLSPKDITKRTSGAIQWSKDMTKHQNGVIDFALRVLEVLTTEYGFPFWLLSKDHVRAMVCQALEARQKRTEAER